MPRITNLELIQETDLAIQVKQEIQNREPCIEWIPKSVCTITRYTASNLISINMEDWFFEKQSKLIEK